MSDGSGEGSGNMTTSLADFVVAVNRCPCKQEDIGKSEASTYE